MIYWSFCQQSCYYRPVWNQSVSVAQFLVSFTQMLPNNDNQNLSKFCHPANIICIYIHCFPHSLIHTHILLGSHVSKQIFKSLQKYEILSICISFFYLHLRCRDHTKLAWKLNEPFGCYAKLQSAFRTTRPLISANDGCMSLKLNARTQEETQ